MAKILRESATRDMESAIIKKRCGFGITRRSVFVDGVNLELRSKSACRGQRHAYDKSAFIILNRQRRMHDVRVISLLLSLCLNKAEAKGMRSSETKRTSEQGRKSITLTLCCGKRTTAAGCLESRRREPARREWNPTVRPSDPSATAVRRGQRKRE